jgi:transposase-like protein
MKRSWSAEDRRQALELAAQPGSSRASAMTGVPAGTIDSWRHRSARNALAAIELVQPDTGRTWGDRRERVVVEFADL